MIPVGGWFEGSVDVNIVRWYPNPIWHCSVSKHGNKTWLRWRFKNRRALMELKMEWNRDNMTRENWRKYEPAIVHRKPTRHNLLFDIEKKYAVLKQIFLLLRLAARTWSRFFCSRLSKDEALQIVSFVVAQCCIWVSCILIPHDTQWDRKTTWLRS